MGLDTLWFILIGVLFSGFFFLEGFDYGVGILLPFLGKTDTDRRILINSIGPVWDGNEVWMISAGGALFAAFPNWYATLFSGFYILMFIILIALILRGVSFEFRNKVEKASWKALWDTTLFTGSLVAAFLWGVVITNLIKGVPIAKNMEYVGNLGNLLTPMALLGGIVGLVLFIFHGSVFLMLRTEGGIFNKIRKAALKIGLAAISLEIIVLFVVFIQGNLFSKPVAGCFGIVSLLLLVISYSVLFYKKYKIAMFANGLSVVMAVVAVFSGLYPKVMVSSLNSDFSLTIANAASSPYTLKVITIVTLTLLPIILAYQVWTYWIFRKRVSTKDLEY
jgi:cytochrome bd ubiquinol oxidase subunit II